jgi:hypothetical protein
MPHIPYYIGEGSSEENIEMGERGSRGREGRRTLHNEELRNMYYYSPLVTVMISFHFDNCAAFINQRAIDTVWSRY